MTKKSHMEGIGVKILVPLDHILQDGVGPNSVYPLHQLYNKSREEAPSRMNVETWCVTE